MNISSLSLKKTILSAGVLFLGWAAHAQTPAATDSIPHRDGLHRHWSNGKDSTARRGDFHRGPDGRPGGPDGWAGRGGWDHRPGGERGRGERGHRPGGERGREGWGRPGEHGGEGFAMGHHGRRGGFEHIRYTPEQRRQLMAINKDYRQKEEDLYKKDNMTLKEYKAQLVALRKEKKGKLEALLTPQQKEEIANHKKKMSEDMQVMEAARLERLKLRLNLSDDQVAKIKTGEKSLRDQMKAIHENDDLLPEQKREQEKALFAKRKDAFKSVLTPDQYSQFENMDQHHRGPGGPGEAR